METDLGIYLTLGSLKAIPRGSLDRGKWGRACFGDASRQGKEPAGGWEVAEPPTAVLSLPLSILRQPWEEQGSGCWAWAGLLERSPETQEPQSQWLSWERDRGLGQCVLIIWVALDLAKAQGPFTTLGDSREAELPSGMLAPCGTAGWTA